MELWPFIFPGPWIGPIGVFDVLVCSQNWKELLGDWARWRNLMGVLKDRGIKMQIQLTFDKVDSCE